MIYYVCCRSQKKSMHKLKGKRKEQDSKRINTPCLARMNVCIEKSGQVDVSYVSGHTGHSPDLQECKFLPLSNSAKDRIVQKLSDGVTMTRIVEGENEDSISQ